MIQILKRKILNTLKILKKMLNGLDILLGKSLLQVIISKKFMNMLFNSSKKEKLMSVLKIKLKLVNADKTKLVLLIETGLWKKI